MLSQAITRVRRIVSNAALRVAVGAAAKRAGARVFRGAGYVAWVLPSQREDGPVVDATLARLVPEVLRALSEDWGLEPARATRFRVVCFDGTVGLREFFRQSGLARVVDVGEFQESFFVPWGHFICLVGHAGDAAFGEALSHELCHAACADWLTAWSPAWAHEGYAHYVAMRLSSREGELLWGHARFVQLAQKSGTLLPFRDLLEARIVSPSTAYQCAFQSQAALLVFYLMRRPEVREAGRELVRNALCRRAQSGTDVGSAWRGSFSALEDSFASFCQEVARHSGAWYVAEEYRLSTGGSTAGPTPRRRLP
jgi:hypothetical protein